MSYLDKYLERYEEIVHEASHHCLACFSGMFDGNDYFGSRYFITNKRIIFKKGLVFKSIESIAITKVERVVPSQKWYQRIFGTGQIEVYGVGSGYYKIEKISDPIEFYRKFEQVQYST